MLQNNIVRPKLSAEELQLFRERLDRRAGAKKAAEALGVNRNTITRISLAGTGSEETIKKVRQFINQPETA